MICWLDMETTGLDPSVHTILEIGAAITDDDLTIQSTFEMIRSYPRWMVNELDPVVVEMHTKNGLWDECARQSRSLDNLMGLFEGWLFRQCETPFQVAMAGFGPHFDRKFLEVNSPVAAGWFHYRNIDIRTVTRLASMWRPDVPEFKGQEMHRAMPDVLDAIACAIYHRQHTFIEGANP